MSNGNTPWWSPIVHFVTHAVVGTVIFVVVAIPAWLIDALVEWLKEHHGQPYTIHVLEILAEGIVTLDAILVFAYFVLTAWKAVKEWQ
ncbi:hypothetical protein JY96_21210 [Aquabacterium sp. NJ1]|uniref:hypothetical protein n=1 Tax=Aquabacterium sp. NJ1 TaxID=1538295 RepID=UPI00052D8BCF|nr:hypothetical protein [Aquabacterium sp. NJ1]KGM38697.1 hypothetical protein JY96_21210 [Aquabacterium sp. NJ1]